MKMEKQMFGKQMFAGSCRDNGMQKENFDKQTWPGSSLSVYLVLSTVISGDGSFPEHVL